MDPNMDKENLKAKTKIPLPVAPLPALPNHLLKKVNERQPLNTLAGPNTRNVANSVEQYPQSSAGPSNAKSKLINNRPKSPFIKIDTKFVTMRRGCDFSEFNVAAYKEDTRRKSVPSVICISDDEEHDNNAKENYFSDKDGHVYRKASTSTPAYYNLHTLQPARVKNIKRSLKRPHSRELQGVSPLPNRTKVDDGRVKRRLNFSQSVQDRLQSPDSLQKAYMNNLDREYLSDILTYLLLTEERGPVVTGIKNETRACVINWLMKINHTDGNPAVLQTALRYLDSVLASSRITVENMQLIGATSFWIAAKMHGPVISAGKLVMYSDYAFEVKKLLEAEKIILSKLKYPRSTVVAHDFIYYFAWWCNNESPGEIEVAATFLCLCGMMANKALCQEYPSVIAAASVKNALLLLRKKELMPRLQKCSIFVAAENKATNMSHMCALLRQAVRTIASPNYSYNFIINQYGMPPKYVSYTIVTAANEIAVMDTRSTAGCSKTYSRE
ncbi:uncharacterized protein isoform X2 [Choristoneura fumiferana]|uniref:uncharacterized protein isoform X2 n=1 Tax=Choristoneura fumiferana TaxID=7141 RepID=UPI003D15AF1A